jgi:hypothetical protein
MSIPNISPSFTDAGTAASDALSRAGLGDDNRTFNIAAPGSSYLPPVVMLGALAVGLVWLMRK